MHLKILTPEKTAFDGEVESILAPGEDGIFEILKDHAAILSRLIPGNARLISGGKTLNLHITYGFLEFSHNKGVILADAVEYPGEIDLERARAAKERAQKELENRMNIDILNVQKSLMRALSRERFHQKFPG